MSRTSFIDIGKMIERDARRCCLFAVILLLLAFSLGAAFYKFVLA